MCIAQDHPPPPTHDDLDDEEKEVWTQGWDEQVYKDDSVPPDISLGELLLLYFEWMSVHKVNTTTIHTPAYSYVYIILGLWHTQHYIILT
jgi:hypothetical protein